MDSSGITPASSLTAAAATAPIAIKGKVKRLMQVFKIIHVKLQFDGGEIIGFCASLFIETQDQCQLDLHLQHATSLLLPFWLILIFLIIIHSWISLGKEDVRASAAKARGKLESIS